MSQSPDLEAKIEKAAACLKALAHPLRLQVLCALQEGEKNVQQLDQLLGTPAECAQSWYSGACGMLN